MLDIIVLLLVLAIFFGMFYVPYCLYKRTDYYKKRQEQKDLDKMITCPNCDYDGEGLDHVGGHFMIEIILYLTFIVPGLIYTIWRKTSEQLICPKCRNKNVVLHKY